MCCAKNRIYLAWFVLHFLLITAGSCRDTLWLIARGLTIIPRPSGNSVLQAEKLPAETLAQDLPVPNPLRRVLATYLHVAGVERGYGYFAPNIPPAFNLVFELHHRDGRVEYQLPRVHSAAAGLRLAGLLDEIARTPHDRLREYLVKTLARSIWRGQPDVVAVRAIFGAVIPPGPNEFERGERESYQFLYAYDFSRVNTTAEPEQP
jgi:hypothetical protein